MSGHLYEIKALNTQALSFPDVTALVSVMRETGATHTPEFQALGKRVKELSRTTASSMEMLGAKVLFGGTDNHIVIVDVSSSFGMSGIVAQRALEECGIIINKNRIVHDTKPVTVASGIRFGANSVAARALTKEAMTEICQAIVAVLKHVVVIDDKNYELSNNVRDSARAVVRDLCNRFPLPGYAH